MHASCESIYSINILIIIKIRKTFNWCNWKRT